ncbi:hypothetical protein [Amphibacillus jilinensis]|uniref:fluoroquinolone export ABC transporter permease subunit n=1 Tax=Amphibacillus jilinensis TaxID=1216008 RepID=UPI0002E89444|nr:hypothetical protein [Amphibacillus jilinensis]
MINKLLIQDIRFQFRHGFYYAYLVVTLVYIGLLLLLPYSYRVPLTLLVVFTDPAALGFFFVGAILLLERNQHLLTYIFVTPIRITVFLFSKLLSLFLISLLTSVIIVMVVIGSSTSYFQLVSVLLLTSCFFTLCGLYLAVTAQTLNHFLFQAILLMLGLYLPLLSYFQIWNLSFMHIFPTYSAVFLLQGALQGGWSYFNQYFLMHTSLLLIWNVIAFFLTYQRFKRYMLPNQGDGRELSL